MSLENFMNQNFKTVFGFFSKICKSRIEEILKEGHN